MSELPAPYVSPWKLLGHDLRAAAASLRLRLRELWRRNREGDLPRPPFWPRAGAPLFWPLALALALALAVEAVGVLGLRRLPPSGLAQAGDGAMAADPAAATPPPVALPIPPSGPAPEPAAPQGGPDPPEEAAAPSPALLLSGVAERDPALDALRRALVADDDPGLIQAVYAAGAGVRLELAPTFASLSAARRQRLAEDWLQRSRGLGYDILTLEGQRQQLIGRSARVGSGMILLAPPAADAASPSPAAGASRGAAG